MAKDYFDSMPQYVVIGGYISPVGDAYEKPVFPNNILLIRTYYSSANKSKGISIIAA